MAKISDLWDLVNLTLALHQNTIKAAPQLLNFMMIWQQPLWRDLCTFLYKQIQIQPHTQSEKNSFPSNSNEKWLIRSYQPKRGFWTITLTNKDPENLSLPNNK